MFIISLTYKKSLEKVEEFIEEHIKFLNKYYLSNKFIFSGRKVPRNGGIILANHLTLEEVNQIIKEDPFYQNQIADYEIIEFTPTKYDDNFRTFIE